MCGWVWYRITIFWPQCIFIGKYVWQLMFLINSLIEQSKILFYSQYKSCTYYHFFCQLYKVHWSLKFLSFLYKSGEKNSWWMRKWKLVHFPLFLIFVFELCPWYLILLFYRVWSSLDFFRFEFSRLFVVRVWVFRVSKF